MNSNFKLLSAGLLVAMLALAGCGGGSDTPAGPTAEEMAQMEAAKAAADALQAATTAATALASNTDADTDDVEAVAGLIMAARGMVMNLAEADQANATAALDAAQGVVDLQNARIAAADDAAAKQAELDEQERKRQEEEAKRMAAEMAAKAAMAAKLYAGISAQMGNLAADGTGLAANDRDAAYNTAGTAIILSIGGETAPTEVTATLSEDKKTPVADNHGWEGKRYMHSVTSGDNKGDMYEAIVYSDVGPATMGEKFSAQYPDTAAFVTAGVVTIDTSGTDTPASRVASPSFDQSAGTKTFKLPDPNPSGVTKITLSGSFHGVSGTYTCTPTAGHCAATLAAKGFTLGFADDGATPGDGTWTFKPTSAEARVTEIADSDYSSYGWWLYTKADGSLTASAFVDDKGTAPTTAVVGLVAGSATYRGGAAGKYALSSSTGGTNDAGHFTARATLEADFEKDEVTGTIDQFMDGDGDSKDWSVELKKSALFDDGTVIGDPARTGIARTGTTADDVAQKTVWTIGGTPAAAAGNWSGALKDTAAISTDDSGVPKVATGTFYSTYGQGGKMVGAFGANKQ